MEFRDRTRLIFEAITANEGTVSVVTIFALICGFVLLTPIFMFYMPTMIESQSFSIENCYSGPECFELEDGKALWKVSLNNIVLENQAISLGMIPRSSSWLAFTTNLSISVEQADREIATEANKIDTIAKTCEIECDSPACSKCKLVYLPIIDHSSYIIELTFLDPIPEQITSIEFELSFINRNFTIYQLAIKYFFFSLSVVSLVVYFLRLCAVPFRNWPFDSKLAAVLSVSLVVFNEPLFALNIYEPSEAMFVISSFCINQFLFLLIGLSPIYIREQLDFRLKYRHYVVRGIGLAVTLVVIVLLSAEHDLENRYGLGYKRILLAICFVFCCVFSIIFEIATFYLFSPEISTREHNKDGSPLLRLIFLLTLFISLGSAIRSSPDHFRISIFLISQFNFLVLFLVFDRAPKRVSGVYPDIIKEEKEN